MRGRRQQHGPEERQPAPRVAEEHEALMGAVDPLSQLLDPHGHPVAAALEPRGQPVDGVACPGGADHGDEHDDADDAEDPEAGAEQPVVGDPQHHVVLRERLAGAEVDGEGARHGEKDDGCNERHERGRHRLGEPDARPPHHPHHRGTRAGLERREIGRPRAHPARDHHVAEPHARMHVPGHDPEPGAAADPVHGGESEAEEHPSPTQVRETGEEPLQVLAEEHQDEEDPDERDDGEQFEPAAEQTRRQGERHGGRR